MTRLDDIRARLHAATPGPWGQEEGQYTPVDHEGCATWPWTLEEDMNLAYHAPEDIAFLLAIVEKQREALHNVVAHTGYLPAAERALLVELLASCARIARAALVEGREP